MLPLVKPRRGRFHADWFNSSEDQSVSSGKHLQWTQVLWVASKGWSQQGSDAKPTQSYSRKSFLGSVGFQREPGVSSLCLNQQKGPCVSKWRIPFEDKRRITRVCTREIQGIWVFELTHLGTCAQQARGLRDFEEQRACFGWKQQDRSPEHPHTRTRTCRAHLFGAASSMFFFSLVSWRWGGSRTFLMHLHWSV